MHLEVREGEEILILRLKGELDLHTTKAMKEKTEGYFRKRGSWKGFILNLEGITFIDSAGIGAILGRFKRMERLGGHFFITGLTPQVQRLFQLAGLLELIPAAATEQEALSWMTGQK